MSIYFCDVHEVAHGSFECPVCEFETDKGEFEAQICTLEDDKKALEQTIKELENYKKEKDLIFQSLDEITLQIMQITNKIKKGDFPNVSGQ